MKHLETNVQQSKDNVDNESAATDESNGNTTPRQQQNSGSKKSKKVLEAMESNHQRKKDSH